MSYYSSRRGERSNRSAPPCFDQNDAYYNSQPLEPRPNFGYPPKETLMVSRPQARGTPPPETGRGIASRNDYYRDNTREYHDEKKEHAPDSYFQETYGRSKRYEDLAKQQEADIKAYNSSGRKLSKKARRGLEELGPEYRVSGDPPETRDWHNRGTVLHEQAIDTYSKYVLYSFSIVLQLYI